MMQNMGIELSDDATLSGSCEAWVFMVASVLGLIVGIMSVSCAPQPMPTSENDPRHQNFIALAQISLHWRSEINNRCRRHLTGP
eukprot:SAG11_NODE_543_length_8635_cov_19.964633_5_plen_84_part_00